jgi:hypothetical protein
VSVGVEKETQRSEVTSVLVLVYFNEPKDVLPICLTPDRILDMDETGLSLRPMKGKRQKVVSLKNCTILPTFHEGKAVSHLSLVATVTLGGQSLIPLILATSDLIFKGEDLQVLRRTFIADRIPRGECEVLNCNKKLETKLFYGSLNFSFPHQKINHVCDIDG